MKDCIIVLSGGIDSTTLLYEYQDRIAMAVTFDYGSNHNANEIPFAEWHCKRLNIKHIVIKIDFMKQYFSSSLLDGADTVPEGHYDDANMRSTVVPFRNGIMLAIAAGFAENNNLAYVMIANHAGDHAIYPDCRAHFIDAMSEAIGAGTYNGAKILAPYTNLTKAEILMRGKAIGVDYSKTWSCYKGGEVHCGKCGTCTERKEAFKLTGIEDKTIYKD